MYTKPQTLDASPSGDTVKTAIVSKVDVNATQIVADLNTHEALTETHGATGAIVGTTNTQTLTNKTLTAPTITGAGAIAGVFTGNLTGNVTGNLTGNVTGDVTGNVTGNCSGSSGSCTGNSATATLAATATNYSSIPSGTKMVFYQDTAPTGWTIANTLDDKVLYVTKGSAASGQTGGGVHSTGTWTQPDHTLTTGEIPSHTHTIPFVSAYYGLVDGGSSVATVTGGETKTSSSGSGGAHNHGTTWRPAAYCVIIATKD